jgi:hypothetical protein
MFSGLGCAEIILDRLRWVELSTREKPILERERGLGECTAG